MPSVPPEVTQWIRQLADSEQAVAFYAYQSLQEHVLRAAAPGQAETQAALAAALGEALTADARSQQGAAAPASFGGNAFLNAVASQRPQYRHPPPVRVHLARLLGYLPNPDVVPYLSKALDDLEARDMARCSLEGNPSEAAVDALIGALRSVGTDFLIGVLNSLAKRRALRASAAIRDAANDPHPDIRAAALNALAALPEPSHDEILEKATRSLSLEDCRAAHIARVRLAATLQSSGNQQAAARIYKAVLASDAAEPQKKAARLALALA